MWQSVKEYLYLIAVNIQTYIGLGPIAADKLLQFFFHPYRQWASAHGKWRRTLVLSIAGAALIWAQFAAFDGEYKARQQAEGSAKSSQQLIEGEDGSGGLKHEVANLQDQLKAKDNELAAVRGSKTRIQYVQVPAAPLQVHFDAAGAPYIQPHLSAEQKDKLREALMPLLSDFQKKQFIVYASNLERASIYAMDFLGVLKGVGIHADGPAAGSVGNEEDRGVLVGIVDPAHSSELSKRFIAAIRAAGIEVKTTHWNAWGDATAPPDMLDFDLFVVE